MKAKPILFSTPMVQALLEGRKTQTRRIFNPQPSDRADRICKMRDGGYCEVWKDVVRGDTDFKCPYGTKGDLLWVRETWSDYWMHEDDAYGEPVGGGIDYKATWNTRKGDTPPWKPSIHMPRWASRLTLEITDIRVERLQDMPVRDIINEGVNPANGGLITAFWELWDSIHGKGSWESNPFVWVISFKVHKCNVDDFQALINEELYCDECNILW